MAFKPDDLLKTIYEEEEKILSALESRVDQHLKKSYNGGTIRIGLGEKTISNRVQSHLEKLYKDAGWYVARVEYKSSQHPHDSGYYEFVLSNTAPDRPHWNNR